MRPDDIREFLTREPFRPFRLTLFDGRTHDVQHPELALVGRSTVTIGLLRPDDPEGDASRFITISLLHILQVEAGAPGLGVVRG